jgi:hypothetical protein
MIGSACRLFGEQALEEILEFRNLSRVTSDCKPFGPGEEPFVLGRCSLKRADIEFVNDGTWDVVLRARVFDRLVDIGGCYDVANPFWSRNQEKRQLGADAVAGEYE